MQAVVELLTPTVAADVDQVPRHETTDRAKGRRYFGPPGCCLDVLDFAEHRGCLRESLRTATQEPGQRTAGEGISRAQVDPLGDRRGDLAVADRFGDDLGGRRSGGRNHQQGHMHLAAIETHAVTQEAVLTKLLAMVGRDDHERVLQQTPALDLIKEKADLAIEVGDATIVRIR